MFGIHRVVIDRSVVMDGMLSWLLLAGSGSQYDDTMQGCIVEAQR